jgi:hypothetical protein
MLAIDITLSAPIQALVPILFCSVDLPVAEVVEHLNPAHWHAGQEGLPEVLILHGESTIRRLMADEEQGLLVG